MKKVLRIFSVMTLAFGMVMAVSCKKGEDNGGTSGGDTPAATNPLVGHTFVGDMTDDNGVEFNYTIVVTNETKMSYELVTFYQGEDFFSDQDQLTYTFNNNAGKMTFAADGYQMNYTYDPDAKTISFSLVYNLGDGNHYGGPVVLYRES